MSRRGPTHRSSTPGWLRLGWAAGVVAAAAITLPLSARDHGSTSEFQETTSADDNSEAQPQAGYQVDDIPYAMRADALFEAMARFGETFDTWLGNRGLDVDTPAVQDLKALASKLESEHPYAPDAIAFDPGFETDDEGRNAWLRQQEDHRYRALGAAFGSWLEARRQEGYPPEFYLDRLLEPVSRLIFSTDSMEELDEWMSRAAREFEAGLKTEMKTLPRQLTAAGWEGE